MNMVLFDLAFDSIANLKTFGKVLTEAKKKSCMRDPRRHNYPTWAKTTSPDHQNNLNQLKIPRSQI